MIYDIKVIINILIANVLNVIVKTPHLLDYTTQHVWNVHLHLSPGTQTYFFTVITTDTYRWLDHNIPTSSAARPPPQLLLHISAQA